ncbi:chromosome segregation protein SMC [Betaproteobacteria bacterium PRO5]|nr:chromosome segregation protein SMC [Nitrosomonas sp. PRO5]MDL1864068.1 chromosome segregation protein SMC [Betaproteobacteria bacterium PRO5]
MILAEYHRFLQVLGATVSPNVRKVANLVLRHFDELQPLTTAQGQRVKKFVELAQTNWEAVSADIQPTPMQAAATANAVRQLKSLRVGPFRGFTKPEDFDLTSSLVLIYGPNGTGKSSFCEALEYGLLGNVADAESKRFREQNDYLKNAYTNTFSTPVIFAADSQGQEMAVQANETAYRFCFVEKNRIDSFSRIAAQTPAKQIELIATLFGMDSFNEFVSNFSVEIDGKYIDLIGKKSELLKQKRHALAGYEQQIKINNEELKKLNAEEFTLANQYREGITFAQMVMELRGNAENAGRIKTIEIELQQPLATKSQLSGMKLQTLQQGIHNDLVTISTKQQALTEASQQLSFKQLYEAVSQVQPSSPEHCPACKTHLQQVTVNPYTHANSELKKLQHLAQLQQELQKLNNTLDQSLNSLVQVVTTCVARFPANNVLSAYIVVPALSANDDWWNSLHQILSDSSTPWQHLAAQVEQLEKADQTIEQSLQQRTIKQQELTKLRAVDTSITQLQTRRTTADTAITSATQAIANFEAENTQLIADAAVEVSVVAKNKDIAAAYADFVKKLNNHKNKLPALLITDLGDKVVELYNAFNRNDLLSEKLASVQLPLSQNQRLQISFQTDPTRFFDALHILSEGHIRCMGLAILMAKNIKEGCPVLIFDDPVNAIDDDHRESIRRTLFEDTFFEGRQIILTCHGEEFFKDIQNLLPAARASQSKIFTFLPRLDESHIRVDFNCTPRNYIISARTHFNNGEIRDALGKARRALESLTKYRLWRYVTKFGDGNLSIKLYSARAPIELRNLTEQLKSKIAKSEFSAANKESVLTSIEVLLGLDGDSREWRYLNKGTHEEADKAEFDQQSVQKIINLLEQIDAAIG